MWYFLLYDSRENEGAYFNHQFLCSLAKLCLLTSGEFHETI